MFRAAAPEAIVTCVVFYEHPLAIPQRDMYFKGMTYRTGRPNVRPQMEHVLGLCHRGTFAPNRVPTTVFPFDAAVEAWLAPDLRTIVSTRPLRESAKAPLGTQMIDFHSPPARFRT